MNDKYPKTAIDLDNAQKLYFEVCDYLQNDKFRNGIRREIIKTKPKMPCSISRHGTAPNGMEYIVKVVAPNLNIRLWQFGVTLVDRGDDSASNPGLVMVMPEENTAISRTRTETTYFIAGHAIDRYCERYLKKPAGYVMSLRELMDFVDSKLIYFASSIHEITGEIQSAVEGGSFLGYQIKGTAPINVFKTFIATHNYYPGQSIMKRELTGLQDELKDMVDKRSQKMMDKTAPVDRKRTDVDALRHQMQMMGMNDADIDRMLGRIRESIVDSIGKMDFSRLDD